MNSMAIPLPAGPGPAPDERPVCKRCGWRFTPNPPLTSAARCELCHGLDQDVARWVQRNPPSPRARRAMLKRELGGVAKVAASFALVAGILGLVWVLMQVLWFVL